MWLRLSRYLLLGCAILSTCLGYEEEVLNGKIKRGIYNLHYDRENGAAKENILEYFPIEIEELVPQIRRYFMGKQNGSLMTQVQILIHIFDVLDIYNDTS